MRFLTAVIVAVLLAGAALPGRAQTASPVTLNSCNLEYSDPSSLASTVSGLRAQFTNNSPKTAHVVNIAADINGTQQIIRDEGTFSTGIEINHRYRVGAQFALPVVLSTLFGKPAVTCSIASVEFADGSKWSADVTETAGSGGAALTSANAGAVSSAITVQPSVLAFHGLGKPHARLALANDGGSLALSSNCGQVATIEILGSTHFDLAFRVTPKAAGNCTISLRDINDNLATIPVSVTP